MVLSIGEVKFYPGWTLTNWTYSTIQVEAHFSYIRVVYGKWAPTVIWSPLGKGNHRERDNSCLDSSFTTDQSAFPLTDQRVC